MASNTHQHFVSQFMIRQFMGSHERLFCLDKTTLTVNDRVHGNKPRRILNEAHYYTTDTDDFDGEIVKPLEDRFAPICRECARNPDRALSSEDSAVLLDWCALSLTRSLYFASVAPIAYDELSEDDREGLPANGKAMILDARRAIYERIRQEMHRVSMMLRFVKAPRDHTFFLTDHPPVAIPFERGCSIGPTLLPLSHKLMVALVPETIADQFYLSLNPTLEWLALVQCGWANRLIYSADLESLDFAVGVLSGEGDMHDTEMLRRARLPFFGLSEPDELAAMWSELDKPLARSLA